MLQKWLREFVEKFVLIPEIMFDKKKFDLIEYSDAEYQEELV